MWRISPFESSGLACLHRSRMLGPEAAFCLPAIFLILFLLWPQGINDELTSKKWDPTHLSSPCLCRWAAAALICTCFGGTSLYVHQSLFADQAWRINVGGVERQKFLSMKKDRPKHRRHQQRCVSKFLFQARWIYSNSRCDFGSPFVNYLFESFECEVRLCVFFLTDLEDSTQWQLPLQRLAFCPKRLAFSALTIQTLDDLALLHSWCILANLQTIWRD